MSPATSLGKQAALEALAERRKQNRDKEPIDNAALPAGSPMYYPCIACGAWIVVPEDWTDRPDLCRECAALKKLGWLEE